MYLESVKLGAVKNIGADAFANTKIAELRFGVAPDTVIGKNAFATSTLKSIFVLKSDTSMMSNSPAFSEWGCSEATLYQDWYECEDYNTNTYLIHGWYEFSERLSLPDNRMDVSVEYELGGQVGYAIRLGAKSNGNAYGTGFSWNDVMMMWDSEPNGALYFDDQTVPLSFYVWLTENGTFYDAEPMKDQGLVFDLNSDGSSYSLNMSGGFNGSPDPNGYYTIPDTYKGFPVTGIKTGTCGGGPVKYIVGDNVETIFANAFFTMDNSSVELVFSANSKLKMIESGAFSGFVFDTLSLPASIESIGATAFSSCTIGTLNLPFAEGEIGGAPWGATVTTVKYSQVIEEEEPYTVDVGDMYFLFGDWIVDDSGFKDLQTTYRFNNVEYHSLTLDFSWQGSRIHFHPDAKLPESAFLWMTKHGEFDSLPAGAVNYGATEGLEIVLEGEYDPDNGYDFREAYVVGLGPYTGNSLVIPDTYEGYSVVGIRNIRFGGGNVVIPASVRVISAGAFVGSGAASTLNVVMDEKASALTTIESGAFVNLRIPRLYLRYVTELGETAFDGCTIEALNVPFHSGSFTDEPWGATITSISYRDEFVLLKGSYTFNETLTMHPVTSANSVYFDFKYDGVSYTSLSSNDSYLYMGYKKVYFPYNFVLGAWEDANVSRTIEFVDRSGKGYGTWLGDIEFFEWLCKNGTFSEGDPTKSVSVYGSYGFSLVDPLIAFDGTFDVDITFTYKGVTYNSMRYDGYLYFDDYQFPYNFILSEWESGGSASDTIEFGDTPQDLPQGVFDWLSVFGYWNTMTVSTMSLRNTAAVETASETISFGSSEPANTEPTGDQLIEAVDTSTGWSKLYR